MFNFDKTLQLYWLIDAACVFIVLLIPMIYRAIAQRQRTYRFKRRKPFRVRHANSNTANDECSAENIPLINIKSQRKPEWVLQETLRLKVLMGQAGCRNRLLLGHGRGCRAAASRPRGRSPRVRLQGSGPAAGLVHQRRLARSSVDRRGCRRAR